MRTKIQLLVLVFLAGAAAGAFAARKITVGQDAFRGKAPEQAATELLGAARILAENDSWQNIAVARVLYLTGSKSEAQAIFDRILSSSKAEPGDLVRVARIYREAGEWDRARSLFDRVLGAAPKDEDWAAEIGIYHLLAGDRTTAETLFATSLAEDPSNLYNIADIAGAYLGLAPRR